MQTLKLELGVKLFQERNKQLRSLNTAEKMRQMSHNLPTILRTIYAEDKLRTLEQQEDENDVLVEF